MQFSKAEFPISSASSGRSIVGRLLQSRKASLPISFTLSGIVTDIRLWQHCRDFPILVIVEILYILFSILLLFALIDYFVLIDLNNYYGENEIYPLWNKDVILSPSSLLFWFDFFDGDISEIGKFSV